MMAGSRSSVVVLGVLLAGAGGCVVPIGPEWSDPQKQYPPTIPSANPPIGSVVDAESGSAPVFEVVVEDQNTQDQLYLRWLIDYPPYQDGLTRIYEAPTLPPSGSARRPSVLFAPSCNDDSIAKGFPNHRLLLAVSDRPFVSDAHSGVSLDVPSAGGAVVEAAWQFTMTCP